MSATPTLVLLSLSDCISVCVSVPACLAVCSGYVRVIAVVAPGLVSLCVFLHTGLHLSDIMRRLGLSAHLAPLTEHWRGAECGMHFSAWPVGCAVAFCAQNCACVCVRVPMRLVLCSCSGWGVDGVEQVVGL